MSRNKAFTLVELLIVVVILGILAMIVLPRFSNASAMARASMLADDLRVMRTQLEVFKSQHNGQPAGYIDGEPIKGASEEAFRLAMTSASTAAFDFAEPGTAGFPYGPYLREIPTNPLNGKDSVQIIQDDEEFPDEGDDSDGWVYQPRTLKFMADSPGQDEQNRAYTSY